MRFNTRWIDVTYEAVFAKPAFELTSRNVAVLKALYEEINPRFAIPTNNLQAIGGTTLADVRVRVTLFNGNGILDLSVEKFSALFFNLTTQSDIAIVKDCIDLAEHGLRSSLPEYLAREIVINTSYYIQIDQEDAADFLHRLAPSRKLISGKAFDATDIHCGLLARSLIRTPSEN